MKPEQYFLRYAFPCAHVLLENGSIDEQKLEELRQNTLKDVVMERKELMTLFHAAFRRIRKVASEMNKDVWDMDVLRAYFLEKHNMFIDEKEGNYAKFGETFRNFCKIYKARIIAKEENVLMVEYEGKHRNVLSDILPEANVGDTVTIHQGFAVERIE